MANKYIDRTAGDETIGASGRRDTNPELKLPEAQEPGYVDSQFTRQVDNYFPSKPSIDGLLRGIDNEMIRIEKDIQEHKNAVKVKKINVLNTAMLNLNSYIKDFSIQYLQDNPDGQGLQKAVLNEIKSSLVGLAINTEDKEIQDAVLPKFQQFIVGHSNDAMVQEASALKKSLQIEYANRLSDIVRGVSTGDTVKYNQYRALLDNEFLLLDAELGGVEAQNIKTQYETEFQKAYGLGIIERDPAKFITLANVDEDFKKQFSPGMFDYLKQKATNEYGKQQVALARQEAQMLLKQTKETQMLQANAVYAQIMQDPFSYTIDDIQKLNLPFQYTQKLIKHQRETLKAIGNIDIERSINQDKAISGFGASHYDNETQRDMVEYMTPSNNKNIVHPKDRLKIANMLGTSYVDQAKSTAMEIDMFNTQDQQKCKMLYETFKEAIQTRNNIYGDLNDNNISLAHDFVDFVDAMTDGKNVDDKTLLILRNNFKESIKKNKNKEDVDFAKTQNGEIENKEYSKIFDDIKERFDREYHVYNESFYFWETNNTPSNKEQILSKLNKIPEEISRLENRGIPRNVASKMAYNKFIKRMAPSVLHDNNELMYMPPEYTVAGCMADNAQREERINNLKLRHIFLCNNIEKNLGSKANSPLLCYGVEAVEWKNKPKITYNEKNATVTSVEDQTNNGELTSQLRLSPTVKDYKDPVFTVKLKDGRSQDMHLRCIYDDRKREYNLFFYHPKTRETFYLIQPDGKRFSFDYNDYAFVTAVDRYYTRYKPITEKKRTK